MRTKLLLLSLFILSIFGLRVNSQKINKPKLVIQINVDELQTDHLIAFEGKIGNYGFKRLINQGTFYFNANYNSFSSYAGSKVSNMMTGTYPEQHGIISDNWYEQFIGFDVDAFDFASTNPMYPDSGVVGTAKLMSSTFTDELQLVSNGESKVASIGISPAQVAFAAGHNSTDVYWFNRATGGMCSQANDSIVPQWLTKFDSIGLSQDFLSRQWGPMMDIREYEEYAGIDKSEIRHFLYDLNSTDSLYLYDKFAQSPYINSYLRDFVAAFIINEDYGKDYNTDYIYVNFTCKPSLSKKKFPSLFCAEEEDMILRLDADIASLLKFIEGGVGLENTLVVLSSTPKQKYSPDMLKQYGFNTGYFSGNKISALLNLYLMAIYGQGKWVLKYHDRMFYLNHELITKNGIDIAEITDKASDFLLDVAGVDKTISSKLLRTTQYQKGVYEQMQDSYYYNRSGDIYVSLLPGWAEEGTNGLLGTERVTSQTQSPLIFWGCNIENKKIMHPVEMINVASTLSAIMQIPLPNCNIGSPLIEIVQ